MNGKFIYLNNGDKIYCLKMIDYSIVKLNARDFYNTVKTKSVKVLSESYLDVVLENGETIFPNINNKAHTIISHDDDVTTHRIYATSVNALLEAAGECLRNKIVSIRTEIDTLKTKELKAINTMTKILEAQRENETTITTEEFATMAL